jgi:protein TonB
MKDSKRSQNPIRQNEGNAKPSLKHDVNLQKNSTLYFQIGIILCLLSALALLEMKFESNTATPLYYAQGEVDNVEVAYVFKPYERPKPKAKPVSNSKVVKDQKPFTNAYETTEEDDFENTILEKENTGKDEIIDTDDERINVEKPDGDLDLEETFVSVEHVPIYPGCERKKGNEARKKCMSDKISKLVQNKFNGSDIASNYGLHGLQRIYVEFQIDKKGEVTNIRTRAPHPKLEQEAERVVAKIPSMKPGMQRDKPVSVRYTLPINFKMEN